MSRRDVMSRGSEVVVEEAPTFKMGLNPRQQILVDWAVLQEVAVEVARDRASVACAQEGTLSADRLLEALLFSDQVSVGGAINDVRNGPLGDVSEVPGSRGLR